MAKHCVPCLSELAFYMCCQNQGVTQQLAKGLYPVL
jgi:hypothetical protein